METAVNLGLVLELRMVDLNNSYFTATGPARGEIQEQLQATREEIQANTRQVQAVRQALSTLESEAAMEGIPPGTIREMIGELPTRQSIASPDFSHPLYCIGARIRPDCVALPSTSSAYCKSAPCVGFSRALSGRPFRPFVTRRCEKSGLAPLFFQSTDFCARCRATMPAVSL